MSAAFGSGDRVRVVSDEQGGYFVGRVGVVVRRLPASDTFVVRLDGEADGALDPWFGPDELQHVVRDEPATNSQAGLQAWAPHARRDPGAHNLHVR